MTRKHRPPPRKRQQPPAIEPLAWPRTTPKPTERPPEPLPQIMPTEPPAEPLEWAGEDRFVFVTAIVISIVLALLAGVVVAAIM